MITEKENLIKIAALLIHAAKIDDHYSKKEKSMISDFIESINNNLDPKNIIEIAEKDEDDKFVLSEDTCSYAWLSKKLKGDARGTTPLSSDDSIVDEENGIDENHEDFFIVVFADGSVSKIEAADLPEDRDLPGNLVGQDGGS